MKSVAISVIILADNENDNIVKAIASVCNQTFQDYEIIVVDDCPSDRIFQQVAEQYGELENLIYIRNDNVIGKSASINTGVLSANGKYVAFLEQTAEWMPDKLKKQLQVVLSEGRDFVYSELLYKGKEGKKWPPVEWAMQRKEGMVFPSLLLTPLADLSTILVKKELFIECGGMNQNLAVLPEYEFMLRVAEGCPVSFVDEVLAVSSQKRNHIENKNEEIAVLCQILIEYRKELETFGLKKIKFEDVLSKAINYNNKEFYFQYLVELSSGVDNDYIEYVGEHLRSILCHTLKETIETPNVSGVRHCIGCLGCYNICPFGAIEQGYDENGFIRPVINDEKCQKCGLCIKVCPSCNECEGTLLRDECYAVIGDEKLRQQSSSGGVFPMLATEFLKAGGYVAGAVYDEKFEVRHIVSDRYEDLLKMQSSKYVQSNMGTVYSQIKEKLENGKSVLFSGCACQVAGLKSYLGREYEGLVTVDVVCHGVPSPKVFEKYINDISGGTENIQEISFRKKDRMGWRTGFYMKLHSGEEVLEMDENPYIMGFLGNWFLQESCYECRFKNKQYSDITLGDFWGIDQWSDFADEKGTSLMIVNTKKGEEVLEVMAEKFKKISITKTHNALMFNPAINQAARKSKCRELFFEKFNNNGVQETICDVFKEMKYDVGLVYWWSQNYGNALTNYALHRSIKKLNKSVLVIDNLCPVKPVLQFADFAKEHYECSSDAFSDNTAEILNMCCDAFVVGSDQVWNKEYSDGYHCGYFYQLDFVDENRKKLSYAASFGSPEGAMTDENAKKFYQCFDAISVREEFGVGVCEELYHVSAKRVMDPVFLLNKDEYAELAAKAGRMEKEPYIVTYLLNPTEEKRKLILEVQKKLGIKVINIIDASPVNREDNMAVLGYENIRWGLKVEEFVSYIMGSEYVITDSYHGTCFAVIFNKMFVALQNRQAERFAMFRKFEQLQKHIIGVGESIHMDDVMSPIAYEQVNCKIKENREISMKWLEEQL